MERFLILWTGGYEAPQLKLVNTDVDAHATARLWAADIPENMDEDRIDVYRLDLSTNEIEPLATYPE